MSASAKAVIVLQGKSRPKAALQINPDDQIRPNRRRHPTNSR
jgi:hypothetical protein